MKSKINSRLPLKKYQNCETNSCLIDILLEQSLQLHKNNLKRIAFLPETSLLTFSVSASRSLETLYRRQIPSQFTFH